MTVSIRYQDGFRISRPSRRALTLRRELVTVIEAIAGTRLPIELGARRDGDPAQARLLRVSRKLRTIYRIVEAAGRLGCSANATQRFGSVGLCRARYR